MVFALMGFFEMVKASLRKHLHGIYWALEHLIYKKQRQEWVWHQVRGFIYF